MTDGIAVQWLLQVPPFLSVMARSTCDEAIQLSRCCGMDLLR
jgi:hypothetical protein